jgi:hypothetical protein
MLFSLVEVLQLNVNCMAHGSLVAGFPRQGGVQYPQGP